MTGYVFDMETIAKAAHKKVRRCCTCTNNDHMFTVLMVLICSCRVAMLGLTLLMQLAMLSCVYMTGRWTLLPGAATSTSTVDLEESLDFLCMRNMPTTNSYHGYWDGGVMR